MKQTKPKAENSNKGQGEPRTDIARLIADFTQRVSGWLAARRAMAIARATAFHQGQSRDPLIDKSLELGKIETGVRRDVLQSALTLIWNLDKGDDLTKLLEFCNYLDISSGYSPEDALPLWPKLKAQLLNIALRYEREATPGSPLHTMPSDTLNHEEAADAVGVSAKTIRVWIEDGKLPSFGPKRRVSRAQLLKVKPERGKRKANART